METLIKYYSHISTVMPLLIKGAVLTVQITALAVFFGTIIGLVLSLMKISTNKIFRVISSVYVDFIRGTPCLFKYC
jgi:polar amino acid transport system permease protein